MIEKNPVIQLPCACATLRRASRAVTQLYDDALRESGLRATQFTLLQALAQVDSLTQGELGSLLRLDSTTLTRSLHPLIERGWIKSERGTDRRERHLRLSASGKRKMLELAPSWERAQSRVLTALGTDWQRLEKGLNRVAGLAQ
jgi:DNA-binding MarR family transcriptional regulator